VVKLSKPKGTNMKQEFIKRFKSFLWRLGSMIAVAWLAFIADNLDLFSLEPQVQVIIALVLSEITKVLNKTA